MEGVHLSLIPELGNKVRRAFIEGVHLERVYLERVDCMFKSIVAIYQVTNCMWTNDIQIDFTKI